jgi:CheY-like chemotaxis protein
VERLAADGPDVELAVTVHDTGVGISSERIPDLFKEFTQLDSSVHRRFGGTGLGLAISNRLVAGMGGSIGAVSEPGRGSSFRFTVRLREVPTGPLPAREPVGQERLDGMHLLVVDDNQISRTLFVRQLGARGARVEAVGDAGAALAALRSAATSGDPYQAALIDHLMPGTNGSALGAAIKADPALAPIRLVLCTAALLDNGARVAAGHCFERVVDKPVPPDVLARALRGVAHPAYARDTAARVPASTRPVNVLVAEDNLTNQLVIRAMIERLGHRAHIVGTGEEALAAIGERRFDIVLMDVMMPGIDGIEATRQIRALPAPLCAIPVFGLTAHAAPEDHAIFRAAGMDSILTKPVTAKALAAALAPIAVALDAAEA